MSGLFGLLLVSAPLRLHADADNTLEAKVKAAIMVKIAKFVEWPPTAFPPSAPLSFCLVGETPMGAALAQTSGQAVQNHEIKVVPLSSIGAYRLETCQILFLGKAESTQTEAVYSKVKTLPVLTVGDSPGFASTGGMIELVREDNHLGFRINLKSVKAAKLKLSAQLLTLAKIVE